MNEKNQKIGEAKKQRNLWNINPVTRVVSNKRGYNRFRDRKNKKIYEDDMNNYSEGVKNED